ncbi:MAG: tetratricopeptide repeat protein [Bacteroidetes bacterium]|nr:tetratricopeptide repeat protein [Bacteroidota bacterium]
MKLLKYILLTSFTLIYFGCGVTSEKTQQNKKSNPPKRELSAKDQAKALQFYIDGNEKESKRDFSGAIIEYLEALRLDDNDAIYFALAKNYAVLNKNELAKQMLLKAIEKDSTQKDYFLMLGEVHLALNETDSALIQFQNVIKIDPENLQSMVGILSLTEKTKPLIAIEMCKKIINQIGFEREIYTQLATLYINLEKYEEATEIFSELLKRDENNKPLLQVYIDMLIRSQKYDKATEKLKKIVTNNPDDVEALAVLADVYLKQNKWDEVVPILEQIISNDTIAIDYRFRAALVYFTRAEVDSTVLQIAKKHFINLSRREEKDWRPQFYLGIIYSIEKNDTLAKNMFEKVTSLATWHSDAWSYIAAIYFDRKEYKQMEQILTKAINYVKNDDRLFYLLGLAYSQLKENQKAISSYEKARKINPKNLNNLSSLGLEYDNLKEFKKSDEVYEEVLKIDSNNILVLNNYAYSLSERGINLDKALIMSKKSIERDSTNSSFLDTIGWIYFKMGNFDLAEKFIEKSISKGEVNSIVYEHLGDVYAKKKETTKAKAWWSKALEKDQNNSVLKEKILRSGL